MVIPVKLKNSILSLLHKEHFGVVKLKSKARQHIYWPGISGDIDKFIESCDTCGKFKPNNIKEPLISHSIPEFPFNKV